MSDRAKKEPKYVNPWRKSLPAYPPAPKFRGPKRAILILLAFFVLTVGLAYGWPYIYYFYKYPTAVFDDWAYARDYKTYSGQTPQEAYEKFVAILKTGDIKAASKFYSPQEDENRQYQYFQQLKADNKLQNYINKFPAWGDLQEEPYWDSNIKRMVHKSYQEKDEIVYDEFLKKEVVWPAGVYDDVIQDIYFNPQYKVWKLHP